MNVVKSTLIEYPKKQQWCTTPFDKVYSLFQDINVCWINVILQFLAFDPVIRNFCQWMVNTTDVVNLISNCDRHPQRLGVDNKTPIKVRPGYADILLDYARLLQHQLSDKPMRLTVKQLPGHLATAAKSAKSLDEEYTKLINIFKEVIPAV